MENEYEKSIKDEKRYNLFKDQVNVLAILMLFKVVHYLYGTQSLISSDYTPARLVGQAVEILAFPAAFILLYIALIAGILLVIALKKAGPFKKKYYSLLSSTVVIAIVYAVFPLIFEFLGW